MRIKIKSEKQIQESFSWEFLVCAHFLQFEFAELRNGILDLQSPKVRGLLDSCDRKLLVAELRSALSYMKFLVSELREASSI